MDLYDSHNWFRTLIWAVFKEGTQWALIQSSMLEKGHHRCSFITLLTIFFLEKNVFYVCISLETCICYHFDMDNRWRLLLNWVCLIYCLIFFHLTCQLKVSVTKWTVIKFIFISINWHSCTLFQDNI